MRTSFATVLLAVFASTVAAQQAAPRDPANPAAPVPRPVYDSAFAGYRPLPEPGPERWRDANDEVRRLGGHTGHVKPAAKPSAGPAKRGAK